MSINLLFVSSPQHNVDCGLVDKHRSTPGLADVRVLRSSDVKLLGEHLKILKEELLPFANIPDFKVGDRVAKNCFPAKTLNKIFQRMHYGVVKSCDYIGNVLYIDVVVTQSDDQNDIGASTGELAWWCFDIMRDFSAEFSASSPVWNMFER